MMPIFLIGYRCTGKTTTGRLLAKMLNRPFTDTDQVLESSLKTTITKLVEDHGWDYFRQQETRILLSLDLSDAPVVATGGGIILAEKNRGFLKAKGFSAWLYADAPTIITRLAADPNTSDSRPDLTSCGLEEETRKMLDHRTPLYEDIAGISINTADYSPEEAAILIKRRLDHDRL
ncbi:MAG: shikimate kinase [Desulfobacterales bacterium]|nr:shikimate kinase [Desulfobacterales bacterium]